MIVKYENFNIMAHVPHKCGISSVINYLAWPYQQGTASNKKEVVKRLSKIGKVEYKETLSLIDKTDALKIAVVRDPVSRVSSVWSDRVLKKNKDGLENKSWQYFIDNFTNIRKDFPDIRLHSRPYTEYIDHDLTKYDLIINSEHIDTVLIPWLNDKLKCEITPNRRNVSKSLRSGHKSSDDDVKMIKEYYKKDYEIFSKYF
jgi:hypothetical protein